MAWFQRRRYQNAPQPQPYVPQPYNPQLPVPLSHHRHYQHRRERGHTGCTTFLLLCAFILFLLVALSLPIIKPIYLLQLDGIITNNQPETSIGTQVRFGVWGLCVTSALDQPTLFTNDGVCIGPRLGYTVDPSILSLIGNEQLISIVLKGVTVLLVLHPIAAGLSLTTLVPILLSCCCGHHAAWILSLIASIVTAIVSSVVLAADLALVIIARNKVKDVALGTFDVKFGNGVWMMVAGVALIWLCVILLSARACYCCGFRRKYDYRY